MALQYFFNPACQSKSTGLHYNPNNNNEPKGSHISSTTPIGQKKDTAPTEETKGGGITASKPDGSFLISIGFISVLVIMLATVAIAIIQLGSVHQNMTSLVEETNSKQSLAYQMREALRLQDRSLYVASQAKSPQQISEEITRHKNYSEDFAWAYQRMRVLNLSVGEKQLLDNVTISQTRASSKSREVIRLLESEASIAQLKVALQQAEAVHNESLALLDRLVAVTHKETKGVILSSQRAHDETRNYLLGLTALLLHIGLGIAYLVVKQTSRSNQKILHQATRDSLTHLINRQEFERLVNEAVTSAHNEQRLHALFYLDLDQFKVVNDTCGHDAGDELLIELTRVLDSCLRSRDTLARLGGDEFGILLHDSAPDPSTHMADKLLEAIRSFRFVWQGKIFSVGASIGICPIDRFVSDGITALSAADTACYTAKDMGRNRYHIFDANDTELGQRFGQMSWVNRITEALEQKRLCLYIQPIRPVQHNSQEQPHYEVLLRMIDRAGSLIPPGAFLPAAERFGLIQSLDRWVIEETSEWISHHHRFSERFGVISINLSGQSIGDPHFQAYLIKRLKEVTFSPHAICFEITETAAITNIHQAHELIVALKDMGCRFALDDFGCGLSSFAYLKQLPVDYLKIDGSFVKDITQDEQNHALVRAMHHIGKIMNKKTIAEFVEDEQSQLALERIGVDFVQGYHIGKPVPMTIRNMMRNRLSEPTAEQISA